MEVNEDLATKITDNAMVEIDKLGNSDADNDQLMNIINEAMSNVLKAYRPPQDMCPGELLSVLRDASSMGDPHVSEIYSPPRICALASKYGMRAGFSLDLTVLNDEEIPWNFDKPEM